MPKRRRSRPVCGGQLGQIRTAVARVLEAEYPTPGYQTLPDDIARLILRLRLSETRATSERVGTASARL